MKRFLMYIFLFFFIGALSGTDAQNTITAEPWSLPKCLQYANDHNLQIGVLRLNELTAEQNLIAAKGSRLPSLNGTVTVGLNHANNNISKDGALVSQLTTTGGYGINSSMILWNDNYVNNNIQQQRLSMQSADLQVQQAINNVTLLITQNYLSILLAKENLTYVTNLVATSEGIVKQGQIFYEADSIAKKDLLQLQAQLASDRYLLVQTQNTIRQSLLQLKQNLQLPADISFDIATPDTIIVNKHPAPFNEVLQTALREFPDTKIGKLGVDIADLEIAKSSAAFWPTLAATGALGTSNSSVIANNVLPQKNYFVQMGNNCYQNIGVTLAVPLFSNYINKTNRAKASIAYKSAKLNWQNDELILSQAVEQAYLNVTNALQALDAANEQLNAATESYRISVEQFRLEAINTFDLLQQRNQYVRAVQAFTQAKFSALLQEEIYEFYQGKPIKL